MTEPMTTADGVAFLRTPEANFAALADFPHAPRFVDFEGLRMADVDVGPQDGPVALLMHGMPTWGFRNRRIIDALAAQGWQIEPDARIDLHGETLELARVKLQHFIARQRQDGARFILVITGKGASPFARHTLHGLSHFHAPEREGRLRREVPRWLAEDQFRQHVVGFQPSHPRHGGGGAFYVRLRKLPDGMP